MFLLIAAVPFGVLRIVNDFYDYCIRDIFDREGDLETDAYFVLICFGRLNFGETNVFFLPQGVTSIENQ